MNTVQLENNIQGHKENFGSEFFKIQILPQKNLAKKFIQALGFPIL
jgi:hypothetical protein